MELRGRPVERFPVVPFFPFLSDCNFVPNLARSAEVAVKIVLADHAPYNLSYQSDSWRASTFFATFKLSPMYVENLPPPVPRFSTLLYLEPL